MLTDPIADMLTRIRNANTAMHEEVRMPCSKQKVALAQILQKEGYINGFNVAPSTTGPVAADSASAATPCRTRCSSTSPTPWTATAA